MLGTSEPTKGPSLVSMFFHLKAFESLKRFSHVKKSNGVQDRFQLCQLVKIELTKTMHALLE